jgi:excisionase family DNA binding protein
MPNTANVTDLTQRLPTNDEIESAAEASRALAHAQAETGRLALSGTNGDQVQLAPAIADLIVNLLGHVAGGNMVTLVPTGAMLTTQQAADILNVSRPFLSKLLKEGEIPHVPVGSHRRVMFADLMSYKAVRDSARNAALNELADLGQEYDAR